MSLEKVYQSIAPSVGQAILTIAVWEGFSWVIEYLSKHMTWI